MRGAARCRCRSSGWRTRSVFWRRGRAPSPCSRSTGLGDAPGGQSRSPEALRCAPATRRQPPATAGGRLGGEKIAGVAAWLEPLLSGCPQVQCKQIERKECWCATVRTAMGFRAASLARAARPAVEARLRLGTCRMRACILRALPAGTGALATVSTMGGGARTPHRALHLRARAQPPQSPIPAKCKRPNGRRLTRRPLRLGGDLENTPA